VVPDFVLKSVVTAASYRGTSIPFRRVLYAAVLTGKYHGEGKPDGGRMTNEGVKAFFSESEQHAAPMIPL
jgi:hypothetical protein